MKARYCPGCGEKKRLRWRGTWCSITCAADSAHASYQGDTGTYYCCYCGEFGLHEAGECPLWDQTNDNDELDN